MHWLRTFVEWVPWWLWGLLALATVPAAMLSAATALGVASASGTHHHALSPRQRWMGRWGYRAALVAVPGSMMLGLLALAALAWHLLAR
ncbi:hypothetical protein [Silanimonas lenta]|uniref:hypothetical protein n=1 Tax=Silanimonas lenta TaxID=265429 RepID=UPI000423D307|nr:hypothetical protein [Silanimonas lenta]